MCEHLQLALFAETDGIDNLDEVASSLVKKLATLTDYLAYGFTKREGLVHSFLQRTDDSVSSVEKLATATMLLKHGFINTTQLEKYYSSSSVTSLKSGLLQLERVSSLEDMTDEKSLEAIWTTTSIIADELTHRNYGRFVNKHYSGAEFD